MTVDVAVEHPTGTVAPALAAASANAMTVDVEDYYQVQAFADRVDRAAWDSFPSRVVRNTERILDMFGERGVRATFFTLGWVAERHPALIRRVVAEGHELASHGYAHYRVFEQGPEAFRQDVRRTRALLEDIGGARVAGFRAASFSMGRTTPWAHGVLEEEGYLYSSSIYPIRHDLYGMPEAPRFAFHAGGLLEVPMSTVAMFGMKLPCSGGGYFRLLPMTLSRWALRQVNRRDHQPFVFYFHPWEIDPEQPRQAAIGWKARFRHYTNLSAMEARLRRLLDEFAFDRMDSVYAHLLAR